MINKPLKIVLSLMVMFGLTLAPMLNITPVSATALVSAPHVKVLYEAGEIAFIPTCSWSYPEGFYTKTNAYTYLGRLPVSVSSSNYPGTWECSSVIKHMIRINYTTMWSPLSSQYGKNPTSILIRSMGTNPANATAGFHTDQYYDMSGVQVLNHFYDDVTVAYQTTSNIGFTLKEIVNGKTVVISNSTIGYTLNSTTKCIGGNDDRTNCRWIHKFHTTNLETGTYRIDFTDTTRTGIGASKDGNYQLFFYLTR